MSQETFFPSEYYEITTTLKCPAGMIVPAVTGDIPTNNPPGGATPTAPLSAVHDCNVCKIVIYKFDPGTGVSQIQLTDALPFGVTTRPDGAPMFDKTFDLAFAAAAVNGSPIILDIAQNFPYGFAIKKVVGAGASLLAYVTFGRTGLKNTQFNAGIGGAFSAQPYNAP